MRALGTPRSTLPALALSLAVVSAALPVQAATATPEEPATADSAPSLSERLERAGSIALDLSVVRVLSLGQLVVGTAYFVALSPLSLPGWRLDESWEHFVLTPFDYTFRRELGRL